MDTTKKFLSLEELLEVYPFTKSNVYRLTSQRLINFYKIGKKLFFTAEDVESYLAAQKRKVV